MDEGSRIEHVDNGDYVEFVAAGVTVAGRFRCAECGYGVSVRRRLPRCPMCGGGSWEPSLRNALLRRNDPLH
jgi:rubrerythrin